jgi:hypothetical protein
MITVNIGTNSYDVASTWREVSLKNYADILKVNKIPMTSTYIRGLETIAALLIEGDTTVFFDAMFNELYETETEQIAQHVTFITDNVKKYCTKKKIEEIEIVEENGSKWGVVSEFVGLKGAERVTLELELAEDKQVYDPMELTFAMLARRKNEDGTLKKFDKNDFKHALHNLTSKVPVIDVFGHISFFLNTATTSTTSNTRTFSITTTNSPKKSLQNSPKKKGKK